MEVRLVLTNGDWRNGLVTTFDRAVQIVASILGIGVLELVERPTCDGNRICCYPTEEATLVDVEGAYAPGWEFVD